MSRPSKKHTYTQVGDLLFNLDFWHKHQQPQPNGCINWTAGKHRQGYGMFGGIRLSDDKKFMTVTHRIAMMLKLGRELLRNEFVIHTCPDHNPLCCNPDHLMLGDAKKKAEVMYENGRGPDASKIEKKAGVEYKQNRTYKYSEDDIRWIRSAPTVEIAKKYNIPKNRAGHLRWSMRTGYKWCK